MQRLTVGQSKYRGSSGTDRSFRPPSPPPPAPKPPSSSPPSPQKGKGIEGLFRGMGELSPDRPLFKLKGREIYAEDLLLVLLIFLLLQEKADKSLIAALIYILAE